MNKFKLATAIIAVLILGESAGLIFFAQKSQKLSGSLQGLKPASDKAVKEAEAVKGKFDTLLKENQLLKADRDNLIIQAKNMLVDQSKIMETENMLGKIKDENKSLEQEKTELSDQVAS